MERHFFKAYFFCCMILSGCGPTTVSLPPQIAFSSASIWVPHNMARYLRESDWVHLQMLLATARPYAMVQWTNPKTGVHFKFHSIGIFVEEGGKPCRRYQVTMNYGTIKRTMPIQTTCRMPPNAQWMVISRS